MSESSHQLCILIVEDEMALAMMLEDLLEDAGHRVLKAARLPAAVALAETARIDAAILDINLGGSVVFPAADVLRRRGIPFVFTSGYGRDGLPPEYLHSPMLQKPYDGARLHLALAKLVGGESDPTPGSP